MSAAEEAVGQVEAALEGGYVGEPGGVLELANKARPVLPLEAGKVYAVLDGEGGYRIRDTFEFSDSPRRKVAAPVVNRVETFVDYVLKHGDGRSEVWADARNSQVVAVIDAHDGAGHDAGWGSHRATLKLEHTLGWETWTAHSGHLLSQVDFAELIEARTVDVLDPSGARMLEIAQSFHATTGVEFKAGSRLASGEVKFQYEETVSAKAGQNGDITIPDHFVLGLKPYIGGPTYRIKARLRYRVGAGGLKIGYVLERPEDVLEAAFGDIIDVLQNGREESDALPAVEKLSQPVYFGRP